ncbi:cupin domain-containing protein [Paenibacillus kobensis]|uniref:cupin domain-containing protein n=1 Tax=Paenibacillus kobensis TaxID=59841 RepID=UPI000FD7482B|nr:DUF4437 domain-containing protein [Paenibacillus kobensis]
MALNHLITVAQSAKWEAGFFENTELAFLWEEKETGRMVFLLKLLPGSIVPMHEHPRRELAYLLEGEALLNGEPLSGGDFLTAYGNVSHEVTTETGCIFFMYIDYDFKTHDFVSL